MFNKIGAIYKTDEFDKFKVPAEERKLDKYQLARLERHMKKYGYAHGSIVVCTPDFLILDGQHRYEAAKKNGTPFEVGILDSASVADIFAMNQVGTKNWSHMDRLDRMADEKGGTYARIYDYMQKHSEDFTETTLYLLLSMVVGKRVTRRRVENFTVVEITDAHINATEALIAKMLPYAGIWKSQKSAKARADLQYAIAWFCNMRSISECDEFFGDVSDFIAKKKPFAPVYSKYEAMKAMEDAYNDRKSKTRKTYYAGKFLDYLKDNKIH